MPAGDETKAVISQRIGRYCHCNQPVLPGTTLGAHTLKVGAVAQAELALHCFNFGTSVCSA
jgi:hypothetical protein